LPFPCLGHLSLVTPVDARPTLESVASGRVRAVGNQSGLSVRRAPSRSLARACRAGTLVLFHHSPARTDDALDVIAAGVPELARDLPVVVAREGMTLDVVRH